MTSLVELWAQRTGWQIGERNVIVEGTSDVAFLKCARNLWLAQTGRDIFGEGFAVVAAGRGDDGGVAGVTRNLNTMRQLSEADRNENGHQRHRFIGLFDNDKAGRDWLTGTCRLDPRVIRYHDVSLLHPKMPLANGDPGPMVERRARSLNASCWELDWELEDLLSDDLHREFCSHFPDAIDRERSRGGRTHRDFNRSGKMEFQRFVLQEATVDDILELVRLVCALRDYLGLAHYHLQP